MPIIIDTVMAKARNAPFCQEEKINKEKCKKIMLKVSPQKPEMK
jgi:hypothetical protein